MPADPALMSGLGSGGAFRPAGSCPVASQWAHGEYMSHQGSQDSFLLADAAVRDGTAVVRLALWRCVHCGTLLTGIARPDGSPDGPGDFSWLEEEVTVLAGERHHDGELESTPARRASGRAAGGEPGGRLACR